MILDGKITLLVNSNRTTIEVTDESSGIRFLEIKLTPEQLSRALSREALIPCEIDVRGLDKIGKKLEVDFREFEIGTPANKIAKDKLTEFIQGQLQDGWIVSDTFTSKGSFFDKNGVSYVRATLRRWV